MTESGQQKGPERRKKMVCRSVTPDKKKRPKETLVIIFSMFSLKNPAHLFCYAPITSTKVWKSHVEQSIIQSITSVTPLTNYDCVL